MLRYYRTHNNGGKLSSYFIRINSYFDVNSMVTKKIEANFAKGLLTQKFEHYFIDIILVLPGKIKIKDT
jgi:hypothetical protein